MIHNKNVWEYGNDQYVWNEVPSSHNIAQKVKQIKINDLWLDVRERYIYLKNLYLSHLLEKDHPSFIVYVEAVNQIYNQYFN